MALYEDIETITGTIVSGQSLSPQVNLGVKQIVGIAMPAAWTSAALTFQVSNDGGTTWLELYDDSNNEITIDVAASLFIQLDPTAWYGINCVKVRSGTSAAPVTQTRAGGTIISFVLRGVL